MTTLSVELSEETKYEEEHVHSVYNEIAAHFSSTRFKPWPVVERFLSSQPTGAIGLDVGCGNGKYLQVRDDVYIIGSDRSSELIKFATQWSNHEAIVADGLALPHVSTELTIRNGLTHRPGVDFVICIAVVHHLSTRTRRQEAISCILDVLRAGKFDARDESSQTKTPGPQQHSPGPGQALVFVWALEQKSSRRGWDAGMQQDVLVPWVLKKEHVNSTKSGAAQSLHQLCSDSHGSSLTGTTTQRSQQQTYQRYYHLYRQGELQEDIVAAGGKIVEDGYDRDNWWAIFERG